MSEMNSLRPTRRLVFLSGFFLFLSLGGISRVPVPVTNSQSQIAKSPRENLSRAARNQNQSSKARAALLDLPLSFEPAAAANQFLIRGSGYRLMLTGSQATIALDRHAHEKILSMRLVGANAGAKAEALNP